ncbi:MAG: alpha-L-fucosidase [Lentisphaerae bacterium]|nr:alpha-L-fucosidase [Lentisphaerota bacterium]
MKIPSYLRDLEPLYRQDPRHAARAWFRQARYGLFLHYGLYSLVGRHEWVQYREKIPVAEYAKLAASFTAARFDAERIADCAVAAGMRYINLTTRHHDSFCLFRTSATEFQPLNTPCGRDLVAELVAACERRALGLCLYYSHGRDWRHPHAPNNDRWGGGARPEYEPPEPAYAGDTQHNLQHYLDFMTAQITELLTQYGPVAAIWLDGIGVPLHGDAAAFRCQELYDHIHRLQPQVLVSYKQGLTGTEDFFAPEQGLPAGTQDAKQRGRISGDKNQLLEVCTTMCPGSWGYMQAMSGRHLRAEQVWDKLREAGQQGYNLLLNTGPLPDGGLDPEDEPVLRAVGDRLRKEGFP